MLLFTHSIGLSAIRKSLRFSAAMLIASVRHTELAAPLTGLISNADLIEDSRRAADDAVIAANARVRWLDLALDQWVRKLAAQLLADCGGIRDNATFKKFFADAPTEVIRLGLESELVVVRKWHDVAKEAAISESVRAILKEIEAVEAAAVPALAAREEAAVQVARVALKIDSLRESANKARRGVADVLAAYATAQDLERGYGDAFFPAPIRSRKAKGEETAGEP